MLFRSRAILCTHTEGSIMEFRKKFKMLSGRLYEITEDMLKSNFKKGLKPKIRAAIETLGPRGITDAMKLAHMIEDKNEVARSSTRNSNGFSSRDSTFLGS